MHIVVSFRFRFMGEKVVVEGALPGPTSMVLVGVHGNETCGISALKHILPTLSVDRGRVLFGYGNLSAIDRNERHTGYDLNRMFREDADLSLEERGSYEYRRSRYLMTYLDQSSALLDVHASFTPESVPFVICEENAESIVQRLPTDIVVSGFDRIQPGGADYYMNARGSIGICIECGYMGDERSVRVAEDGIFGFLGARGHITHVEERRKQIRLEAYFLYRTESDRFVLDHPFKDFEKIIAGQHIGRDGDREIASEENSFILFARERNTSGAEGFILCREK